jgi:hypothetical protein
MKQEEPSQSEALERVGWRLCLGIGVSDPDGFRERGVLVKHGACHSQKLKTTNLTKMLVQTLSVLDPCGCASALRRGNFEKMTFKINDLKR